MADKTNAKIRWNLCVPQNLQMSLRNSGAPEDHDSPPPAYEQGPPPVQQGYQYPPPPAGQVQYGYAPGQGQPVYGPQYGQVIVQYPPGTYPVTNQTGPPPPDYFGRAIFVTLCCFWPTGILAIMKASDARSATARGDYNSAHISANSAKTMVNLSIGIGIFSYVIACVFLGIYFGVILKNVYDYD